MFDIKKTIPFIFVLLWSTGFIGAKYGLPYAGTGDFLTLRMFGNIAVFILLLLIIKQPSLTYKQIAHAMVTGLLIHGAYLGGVFGAIEFGISAGATAIIVGLQPILTACLAMYLFSEKVLIKQWLALIVGILGITLVVYSQLDTAQISTKALIFAFVALLGITLGTLYQKRFCTKQPLIPSALWQYVASLVVFLFIAYIQNAGEVQWHPEFIFSLAWLVIVLSVISILLLMYMIGQGEAAKVTSYFYLVPPVTVIQAWLLFDEQVTFISIIGMVLCAVSVFIVVKPAASK